MGKRIAKILAPAASRQPNDHLAAEDMARLVEGNVDQREHRLFLDHLNRCRRCYEILQEILKDIAPAEDLPKISSPSPWWRTKAFYALAASIFLIIIIGGGLVFEYGNHQPRIVSATLDLDRQLKDILLENDALRWEKGPRLDRLAAVLHKKGLHFKELKSVILAKPYYQKKSLFGPKEVLHIRIENGVAYLDVEEKK
jgi:hypothetical protein